MFFKTFFFQKNYKQIKIFSFMDTNFENKIKKKFPFFSKNKNIVYVDNASTTQKFLSVIKKEFDFCAFENASVHRGIYDLSANATKNFENTREKIASFFNAKKNCVIFTKGTTQSLNLVAFGIKELIKENDEILITEAEHHANIVPWQEVCKITKAKLKIIPITKNFTLNLDEAKKLINKKTKIISITHISNVLGTINPVEKIINLAKKFKAFTILDCAQSVSKISINFKKLNCDCLCFSAHKMFGQTGVGVLIGKENFLKKLNPIEFGGSMIENVSFKKTTFNCLPNKFEAGTPSISQTISFIKVFEEIEKINFKKIQNYEKNLLKYTICKFKNLKNKNIIWHTPMDYKKQVGIFSFSHKKIHAHDIASILNKKNICVRAGHHCCMPLIKSLKVLATTRISLSFYNTKKDIDKIYLALENLDKDFERGESIKK